MSSLQDVVVTRKDFDQTDWQEVVSSCEATGETDFSVALAARGKELEASGDTQAARVYSLLGSAASLILSLDDADGPFIPLFRFQTSRSAIVSDFTDEHIDVFAELLGDVRNSWMRARLADLVWMRRRQKYPAGGIAVEAYLQSASGSNDDLHYRSQVEMLRRAMGIARSLGQDAGYVPRVVEQISNEVKGAEPKAPSFILAELMEILQEIKAGDPNEFASITESLVASSIEKKHWVLARRLLIVKAQWHLIAGDMDARNRALRRIADIFVEEADQALGNPTPSNFAAALHLQHAIEALRDVPNTKDERNALYERQLEHQQLANDEMMTVSHEIDLTEAVEHAVRAISGKTLRESLFSLALIAPPQKVESIRTLTMDLVRDYPMAHMFSSVTYGEGSRVVHREPGISFGTLSENEASIRAEMFKHARHGQLLTVVGLILPAIQKINQEHDVRIADILDVLRFSPFIPSGREVIFARGLHAGITGDFLVASHVLVPQVENSIRYILQKSGVVTSHSDQYGIQKEWDLNTLLYGEFEQYLNQIIGVDSVFALKGLLVEATGVNLRNNLCHGLIDGAGFNSAYLVYLWWMVLRLCLIPIWKVERAAEGESSDSPTETTPDP